MLTFTYRSRGKGVANMLNYKTNMHGFASIVQLKSSFVLWDNFTSPCRAN